MRSACPVEKTDDREDTERCVVCAKKARKKKLANSEVASLNNIRMRHACIDQTAEHSRHSQCSPSEASDVDARLFG